jgi:tetratricopeptide (TPR) repeat protein
MNKRILFLATLMTIFTMCVYGQNAKKFYKAGKEFIENMKYEDAVAQFTNALGIEPSNPDYYYARGRAYESLSKYEEAKTDFEKVIVFAPKEVDAYIGLGTVGNKMDNFEEALNHLNKASALDKRNGDIYPEKVITLLGLKRYDQALKVSDTAVIIKDTPLNLYYRGIIYTKLNNDVLAKKEFEKSISKDKGYPEPRLALAELLLRNNDSQGALEQCNETLNIPVRLMIYQKIS